MASVTKEVDANPKAKGLAIIITNDYIGTPEFPHKLDELNGTMKDGENFWSTFSSLKFVVHWEHNVNTERLEQIMYEVKHLKHKKVKDYKCIVLVFSGHGTSGNYVYMHDRKEVNISEHLIAPLLPESVKELGIIPKLFFIDACRGSKTMKTVVVPKGKSASEGTSPSRGSSLIPNLKVPAKGNFLVAYSTMPEYRAYENGAGGIWLTVLAKKIMESPGVSIGDVLTDVNEELLEMTQSKEFVVQQPEQLNRLNKKVFLLETEDEQASAANLDTAGEVMPSSQRRKPIINIAAVFPGCNPSPMLESGSRPQLAMQLGNSQPQPHVYHTPIMNTPPLLATSSHGQCISTTQQHSQGSSPETITIQPAVQYETMLIEFAHSNCTNPPTYETVHCFSNEHNRLYFKSCVTVHLRNGITIKEDSRQYYISQQLSQEEAAKNACEVIAQRQMHYQQAPPQYNGTHPLNRQRPQVHSPACSVSVTTQVYTQPHAASTRPLIQGQQSYNGPSCSASIPPPLPGTSNLYTHAAVSGKGLPPSGSDRERLNYFFQTNKVNPQYDYVSDNTGGQPRYRCTIKYFMNGKTERVDSGGYYRSKGEAKEFAAKKVLVKETKGGTFEVVSRGKNTTPQDKIWKSKLKEYYDKRGQPNAPIDYKTFEVALGRFQSTVFTGDFGPGGVQGDVCENKKEAEQSAARKAVKMLNQSVCGISND